MEKVWDELKKIESQAEQIQVDAQEKAKSIAILAHQDAEKLISNSKVYAEDEANQLYRSTVEEANRKSNEQLKANEESNQKLRMQAEKHMDAAVSRVLSAIIKDAKA